VARRGGPEIHINKNWETVQSGTVLIDLKLDRNTAQRYAEQKIT
jgi:hypothetical protein